MVYYYGDVLQCMNKWTGKENTKTERERERKKKKWKKERDRQRERKKERKKEKEKKRKNCVKRTITKFFGNQLELLVVNNILNFFIETENPNSCATFFSVKGEGLEN